MSALHHTLIFATAFLAVFCQSAFGGLRHLLGAQIDLLPALMVYTSLRAKPGMIAALALLGGLFFDSLSANPLGVTILPLFAVGFAIYFRRDLLLRDQPYAQFVLGLAASAATPALTLLLLLTMGHAPLIGWGSLWQWLVMTLAGGLAAPLVFFLFDLCEHAFGYRRMTENSFRPDREIRRGRN